VAESAVLIDTELLHKLERLAIHWQKSLPGMVGGHNTSRFAGPGQEFLDHRHFHQGDDIRDVNWRAYLRLEKLFLKMFQLEPRVPVRILVDLSSSMRTGNPSKFDYARSLAAAMCYIGLVRLESICLQPFAEKLGDPFRLGGGRHRFRPAVEFLSGLKQGGRTNFMQITRDFITRYPQRGLAIILSDFLDDDDCEKPLQYLSDFGHELILVQVWAEEDRNPPWDGELDVEDAETGQHFLLAFDDQARADYTAAFDQYSSRLRSLAIRNGGRYMGVPTSTPVEDAIFGPLVRSGALQ
jgi:uncharacterized protein (DUF58 family)